jgi:FkbM family methyltransferase
MSDPLDRYVASTNGPVMVRREYRQPDENIVAEVFRDDTYLVRDLPSPVKRIIDVGANLGAATRKFLERWPTAEIIAVEPEPDTYQLLARNNAVWPNVFPMEAACLYGGHWVVLNSSVYPNTPNTGGSWIGGQPGPPSHAHKVLAYTLEQLAWVRRWETVDLVKLDCEGGELSILANCDIDRVGVFVGEWHHRGKFMKIVQDRFQGWDFDIIRDGPLGTFRLAQKKWWNR